MAGHNNQVVLGSPPCQLVYLGNRCGQRFFYENVFTSLEYFFGQ